MYEGNITSNLTSTSTPVEDTKGKAPRGPNPEDGIRFNHVGFEYPGSERPVLKDVNLHIRPGESLALVGENGSGKTTLIKLLTRLYQPTEGEITLDGLDLREWDETALRQRIGVIFRFGATQLKTARTSAPATSVIEDEARGARRRERRRYGGPVSRVPEKYQKPSASVVQPGRV